MKKPYCKPKGEWSSFEICEVITMSGGLDPDPFGGESTVAGDPMPDAVTPGGTDGN